MRCWVGMCHRDTETLPLSVAHTHTAYTMEVRRPAFEVFCIRKSRSTGFCILDDWKDFIRVVVLPLRSCGTNFHSNKHVGNYTQDGLVKLKFKYESRGPTNELDLFHELCRGII